jgi:hypothetical protein
MAKHSRPAVHETEEMSYAVHRSKNAEVRESRSTPCQEQRRRKGARNRPFLFFILLSLFALSLGLSWRAGVKLVVSAHKESNTTQHSGYIKAERSRKKKEKTK